MNLNHSVYFLNVLCDDEKRYRIHSVWNDDNGFILTVIDDFKAYRSNISEAILKSLAKKYEVVFEVYIDELRSSLCNMNIHNIIYKRVDDTFTISKKQGSILVQFADFNLNEIDFNNAAVIIMDEINASSKFYQNEALLSKKETETATKEKNKLAEKLEEFVNKKKDMEHELYSKFILVLNEKKLQIQYLQESLEKLKTRKRDNATETEFEVNGSKREVISDSESSADESAVTIAHNVHIECNEETTKKKLNIFEEEDTITIKRLPKRVKINESPGPSMTNNDEINNTTETDNKVVNNTQITKCPEIIVETRKEDSQAVLNFNTQDLFDML